MADEKFICDEYVRNTYDKVLITDMFTRCKKKKQRIVSFITHEITFWIKKNGADGG